jgi:hypothetical protein
MASETVTVKSNKRVATAEELGIQLKPPVEVPAEILESYQAWTEDFKTTLTDYIELYIESATTAKHQKRRQGLGADPEIGGPQFTAYNAFDVFTISPFHFGGLPPFQPGKIVPEGALTVVISVLWTNPIPSIPDGWGVPPTTQLTGRTVRLRGEQINLSTVTDGPDFAPPTFLHPGVPVIVVPWFFIAPSSGSNPQLFEVNTTVDIVDSTQPFAAFSTWWVDIDTQPPFLGIPGTTPSLKNDFPLRYLVFPT